MKQSLCAAYARLAVKSGVNLREHQTLLIQADIDTAEFTRMVVEQAYQAGAREVVVTYLDSAVDRCHYLYQDEETLSEVHSWQVDKQLDYLKKGACMMRIISPHPQALKDCDPKKMAVRSRSLAAATKEAQEYTMASKVQWTIVAVPNPEWAALVFPDQPEAKAMESLWKAILDCVYVNEDSDPQSVWQQRDQLFQERIAKLNAFAFQRLHFTNSLGTDLMVGLVEHHVWGGGSEVAQNGVRFNANIPTEEVFCAPHKDRVEGTVVASRPLIYQGNVIRNFHFTFKNGRVCDFDAEAGREVLAELLAMDEGSSALGEVALVPDNSPISQSNLLFYTTLFDENAACHLALGSAYPSCVEGGNAMNEDELKAKGINVSLIHVDFMFGTSDMEVKGEKADGTWVPIFHDGNFVI